MKNKYWKKGFIILSGLFLFWNCSDNTKVDYKLPQPFSIRISDELTESQADSLKIFLQTQIVDSLYVVINDDDFYTVNIGYFNSSLVAGEKAFKLFCDSLIADYSIYYGDSSKVYDEYRYIPFVGEDLNRPALFKYDLLKKKKRLIWSKWGRKIVNFTYHKKFNPAYFLTALTYGRGVGFPYITDARAYKYNIADNTVKRLEKLGTGLQVFSDYDSLGNYEVYFNILDSANTSNIIQIKNKYGSGTNRIESLERSFNILVEGYPVPRMSLPQLVSPEKNYYLKAEASDSTISYFLNNYVKNKRDFIFSSRLELAKVEWSENEDYLVLSLKDPVDTEYSKIVIISTDNAVVENEFENKGAVNFIVHGNLVIFESWNQEDPEIIIFNYKNMTAYDTLSIFGGCGLNYIKSEYIGY